MKKVIILNLIVVVLIGTAFWFLVGELYSVREAQQRAISLDSEITHLASYKRLSEQVDEGRDKIAAYFINNETLPEFIESLETLAARGGVELDLTQAEVEEKSGAKQVRLELSAAGSFSKVTDYLAQVESLPYGIAFSSVRLDKAAVPDEGPWKLTGSLIILSYRNGKN